MNSKASVNPTSIKWLAEDEQIVADYFLDLGFLSLKEILDMRVFDLMNMQGLDAVRVEEIIICLYKWLNPNTDIDEAIYIGTMTQPFPYAPSERKTLTKEQTAKLHVCEAKHYDYILLKPCSDPKAMAEQILRVFKMKHIFIPTNVDEDIRQAQTAFLNLMRLEIESTGETLAALIGPARIV